MRPSDAVVQTLSDDHLIRHEGQREDMICAYVTWQQYAQKTLRDQAVAP